MIKRLYYSIFGHEAPVSGLFFIQKLKEAGFGFMGASFFGFLLTLVAARMLGPALFGEVQYVLAISAVLTIFPLLGVNLSMIKLLQKDSPKEKEGQVLRASVGFVFINNLIVSLLLGVVFFTVGIPFLETSSPWHFVFLLLFSFFLSFRFLCQSVLQAKEQFRRFSFFAIGASVSALVFFLIASLVIEPGFFITASALLLSHGIFCAFFFLSKRDLLLSPPPMLKPMLRILYHISLPAFFAVFLGVFFQQLDKLLIQAYFDSRILGIYTAYLSLAFMIVSLPMTILNQVLMPCFAKKVMTPELIKLIQKALLISFPFIFGISFILMMVGEIGYGAGFDVSIAFQILFAGYAFFYCSSTFLASIFSVSLSHGFTKLAFLSGVGILLLVIVFFLLAPIFGLEGALLSQVIVLFFVSLASLFLMKREAIQYAKNTP